MIAARDYGIMLTIRIGAATRAEEYMQSAKFHLTRTPGITGIAQLDISQARSYNGRHPAPTRLNHHPTGRQGATPCLRTTQRNDDISEVITMLNRHNLNIATLCSKNPQYYASVIQIRKDRTEATDGHLLIRVDTPSLSEQEAPIIEGFAGTEDFEPFTITGKDALTISKAIPKHNLPILQNAFVGAQTNVNGSAYFATTDLERPQLLNIPKTEGRWPDTDQVVPHIDKADLTISFNAELLSNLLKTMASISDDKDKTVTFRFTTNVSAARIDCDNTETGQHVTGVIMPMKVKA